MRPEGVCASILLQFGRMEKGIWYLAQTVAPTWAIPRNDQMELYQIQIIAVSAPEKYHKQ